MSERPQRMLTNVEMRQIEDVSRSDNMPRLETLAWHIGTKPELYNNVIDNPYTSDAMQELYHTLPLGFRNSELTRAVMLTEPEGLYDRQFRDLSHAEQEEALYQEIDRSADILVRVFDHINGDPDKYWDMYDADVYTELLDTAFQTTDVREIQARFSQLQRRGVRLSIDSFIQDKNRFKKVKDSFENNPAEKCEELFKTTFDHDVEARVYPIGIELTIRHADFDKIMPETTVVSNGNLAGALLYHRNLPSWLDGRLILVSIDDKEGKLRSKSEIQDTRKHELQHLFFSHFMEDQPLPQVAETHIDLLNDSDSLEDFQKNASRLKERLMTYARDEIIAYHTTDARTLQSKRAIEGWFREHNMDTIEKILTIDDTYTHEEKALIYDIYEREVQDYEEKVKEFQIIASILFGKVDQDEISYGKALALLQVTPTAKAHRLARYIGVEEEHLPDFMSFLTKEAVRKFSEGVHDTTKMRIGKPPLGNEYDAYYPGLDTGQLEIMEIMHPVEALAPCIRAVDSINSPYIVWKTLCTIDAVLKANHHVIPDKELVETRAAIMRMRQKFTDEAFIDSQELADELLVELDEVYIPGGKMFPEN